MKTITKRLLTATFILIVFVSLSFCWGRNSKTGISPELQTELMRYCKDNSLCYDYCIIVDFSIYSGKDRLFIVDLPNNKILYSSLCAHGIGKDFECIIKPKFSNEAGSNLSSLGHYKLGLSRKTSQYDLNAIELFGLDSTNSNAYTRGILIHDGLPDVKIIGLPCLPISQGCFTIPSDTYKTINDIKEKYSKPMLLYSTQKDIFN
ncbi:MAG: murein L,D-transpeptidase catalytic domain family protein [Paramuribaculum sp.]|nr:murein L,D-transpeptidase catalytic domain family protein [Paramuribaculum sp.]